MTTLNLLGLKVAGITGLIILAGAVFYVAARKVVTNTAAPTPNALTTTTPTPSPADADSDGLPDQFENIYRTDQNKADTDMDGTTDLQEIVLGRNPTLAGPADETKPAIGSMVTDTSTYTGRYLASLPDDLPRADVLNKERLEAFVNVNKGPLLPTLPADAIRTTSATGKEAIKTYLDSISASHNTALHSITNQDIESALALQLQGQPQPLADVITKLQANVTTLKQIAAPAEVKDLHTKLVAATDSLARNTALLQTVGTDFVGSLIGTKNIEELGLTFQSIAADIQKLEEKYSLE